MSEKIFKKLKGNRVYLQMPEMPNSSILLSEGAQSEVFEAEKAKIQRLKVYAVGELVKPEELQEGDEVFIDPKSLEKAMRITFGKMDLIMVSIFDIAHVW